MPASKAGVKPEKAVSPPTPPVWETFEGQPQLSVFPRVAAARPAADDENLPFWATYLDHLVRTSGVIEFPRAEGHQCLSLNSVKGIDSVAWFAPLAVFPATEYRVKALIKAELPEGASAGIGILEFDQFLWIGQQFSQEQLQSHQVGLQPGVRVTGEADWQQLDYSFRTGSKTGMIHLLLFRDGPPGKLPVLFDDIGIEPAL